MTEGPGDAGELERAHSELLARRVFELAATVRQQDRAIADQQRQIGELEVVIDSVFNRLPVRLYRRIRALPIRKLCLGLLPVESPPTVSPSSPGAEPVRAGNPQLEGVEIVAVHDPPDAGSLNAKARDGVSVLCFTAGAPSLSPEDVAGLCKHLRDVPDAGAVAPLVLRRDGLAAEAGIIVWASGLVFMYGSGLDADASEIRFRRPVDGAIACLAVDAALFRELDGFDPSYRSWPGMATDVCLRMGEMGRRIEYVPDIRLYRPDQALDLPEADRAHLATRFARTLGGRPGPSVPAILRLRDTRGGRRVLMIDDRVPEDRMGSGFPRTRALLESLLAEECVVTYLPALDTLPREPLTSQLRGDGVEVLVGVIDIAAKVRDRAPAADIVIVGRPHNAHLLQVAREANPDAVLVYDAEAVFALRDAVRAQVSERPWSGAETDRRIAAEMNLVNSADLVLTVSKTEADMFRRARPETAVQVWGHAIPVRPTSIPFPDRHDLLFVGFLGTEPNEDAVLLLIEQIMPRLEPSVPGRLLIAGANASPRVQEAAAHLGGRVELLGFVEDLGPLFDRARVFIAPHEWGGGIPVKVIQAMASGVPCALSSLLAGQLGIETDVQALTGDTPAAIVLAVERLYADRSTWEAVRDAAYTYVADEYDPHMMRARLRHAIEHAVEARATRRAAGVDNQ